jgi:hypothetical protein
MIKRISLVARKEGMSPEAFRQPWMGPHAAIVRQLKNLRGLRFNPVIARLRRAAANGWLDPERALALR